VVFSFRASPNAFAPSAWILFPTDTPEWRDSNTTSAKQFRWATLSARQSQQSHSIHGSMDRGLPQSTSNGPTSGMFHTLPQKKTSNTNHERNQDYSRNKSSDNEVSVVKFIRASPNTVAPSAPIILSTKTHPSGEI
jgi:hypothetical protein